MSFDPTKPIESERYSDMSKTPLTKREEVLLRALERALTCANSDPTPLRAHLLCRKQATRTYYLFIEKERN